jgi:hypothetical protein
MVKFMAIYFWPQAGEKFNEKYCKTEHLAMAKKELQDGFSYGCGGRGIGWVSLCAN